MARDVAEKSASAALARLVADGKAHDHLNEPQRIFRRKLRSDACVFCDVSSQNNWQ